MDEINRRAVEVALSSKSFPSLNVRVVLRSSEVKLGGEFNERDAMNDDGTEPNNALPCPIIAGYGGDATLSGRRDATVERARHIRQSVSRRLVLIPIN